MTNFSIGSQLPLYLATNGSGLNNGKVYIGLPNQDPQTFPKTVYWDEGATDPIDQTNGIPTIGGYITRAGSPATVYIDGSYSIRVLDRFGSQIYYLPEITDIAGLLTSPDGGAFVGFQQIGIGATARTVRAKELEDPVTLLDYVSDADASGIVGGTTPINDAFAVMATAAITEGRPARLTKGSYKIGAQLSIPENLTLILEDGVSLFFDDNTLESGVLIEADNVSIYGRGNATIAGPLLTTTGRTGVCVLIRGTSGVTLDGFATQDGKYGVMSLDNDNLVANDVIIRNSLLWGWLVAGTRNSWFTNCGVDTTRGTGSAADGFKVAGYYHPSGVDWSTRSTYNLFFTDCFARNTAAGQTFDIIATNDAVDDLHHIFISNPMGENNFNGLLEMKCDETEGGFTQFAIHDIYVHGGSYAGNGNEVTAIFIANRIYNVVIDGTVITDVGIGIAVANPARYIHLRDITVTRPRMEGLSWTSAAGVVNCVVENLTVINPNWGQAASTYAGIRVQMASQLRFISPTVRRSQENGIAPNNAAHSYGMVIEATCSNTVIEGIPTFLGQATGAINDLGVTTRWPVSLSASIDLASNAAQFYRAIEQLARAFYVCRISLCYDEVSNVSRNIQVQARNPASLNIGAILTTSAAGAVFDTATQAVNPPTRVNFSQIVAQVQPVALPGSPTGEILLSVQGFWDGGSVT